MTSAATSTSTASRHTPSISELQAALLAVRNGQFASLRTIPVVAAAPPSGSDVVAPPSTPPSSAASGMMTGVWLLGTHGGSGVRCLATVLPGTRCAGKVWPRPAAAGGREPVVLVCRGNNQGLTSAQEYARAYRDSDELAGRFRLVGVIVSADAPGRTPTPLRRLERLLSGATPILGHAPWEPAWRIGPPQATPATETLPWVTKISQALAAATAVST